MESYTDDQVIMGEGNTPSQTVEEAIPLVIFNEEKKLFEINEEGRAYLQQLKNPIGVVTVAGMYRTGKSYLLNRMLLDRCDGFGVGPTINPCTKGVWMWSKPLEGLTPEGDPIDVIIMDTEGLGALDEDSNHDVRIFSLAILLSSYFIYNSVGSIDENALQNLNLVVNLTKHIQIKSAGLNDELDPQDFAKYFPSFMWVVRDFTLQLVDSEGDPINAKEYLEKALQQQKGFSESVDQKNRIRRLLKSFFTDRDCVTMIRPLTSEEGLQNLINVPMNELRPEFVEQVGVVRRKVLQRVRPKMINGKQLNGDMFWNLCKSYVDAINKGAIPSIENSWAYICKNECLKALDEAFEIFCRVLAEETANEGPLFDEELKDKYSTAKRAAIDFFAKTAVGEVKAEFQDQLKEKMKQRFSYVKQDNEQNCEQQCSIYLRQAYTEIERALKNQQYPRFIDYLQVLMQFRQLVDEEGPPGSKRREIILDFCMKAVMEAAEFFIAGTVNEINLTKALAEESQRKMQQQLDEMKNDQKERLEGLENKLRKSELEKAEVAAREQSTKEHLQQLKQEKDQIEQELSTKLQSQKKEYDDILEQKEQRVQMAEDARKEYSRQMQNSESEFDKQKALFEQKIEFLDKALEDAQRREKEISVELKSCKKDFLNQSKEATSALEKQIKDQQKTLEDLKEANFEQESKINDLEIALEEQKNKYGDELGSKAKELKKSKDAESELTRKYEQLQKRYETDCDQQKGASLEKEKLQKEKIEELEKAIGEKEETFDMARQQWAKDEAVLKQKLEFAQFQLDEEKKKYQDAKKNHESMLTSLQSTSRESVVGREEAQQRLNEMEQKFIEERKQLDDQHADQRARLMKDYEQLKIKHNELELHSKLARGEYDKETVQLRELLADAEQQRDTYLAKLKLSDTANMAASMKNEEDFRKREAELEQQLDEKEAELEEQIREMNTKSEQQLHDLKRFYEEEKERIERRVIDEKNRAERKFNNATEEYEDRINELNNNHEEAMDAMHDEKAQIEAQLINLQNHLEKENQALQERLESTSRQLAEAKENINNLQAAAQAQAETASEKFSKERRELNDRMEQLQSDMARRERGMLQLENQKETLKEQMLQKERALEELRNDTSKESTTLTDKIEDLKVKCEKAVDDLTQSKINFERDRALKEQKISFQEQRINEYHEQQRQTIERYEERLKQEKEDAAKTLSERIARVQQEKENIDKKYEQKRKAFKDLEKTIQQTHSQNEREAAVSREKYENLERSQKDLIEKYELQNMQLTQENEELQEAMSKGENGAREDAEQWKIKYYEADRLHADLQTEFDKERALWQGKFEFLEKQKEQYKKDNEDAHTLFQQTVDQLQRDQKDTKHKNEQSHNSMMVQIEQKYKIQIRDETEKNQVNLEKKQQQLSALEKENRELHERLEVGAKNMSSDAAGLEKKLEKALEEKERFFKDLETVKQERDTKVAESRKQFEREKELLKQKATEAQQKSKATEARQTEILMSHETNRAKWEQEKSYIIQAKEDAIAEQRALQRKNENLLKEVERYKEQSKRNNPWRKVAGAGGNAMAYNIGKDVIGRLNMGGAGQGLTQRPANELAQSTNNLKLGGIGAKEGGLGGLKGQISVDKSMDNLKLGFGSRFGDQLGAGSKPIGNLSSVSQRDVMQGGAVAQPIAGGLSSNRDAGSIRGSNLLSTPTSNKGGEEFDEEKNN